MNSRFSAKACVSSLMVCFGVLFLCVSASLAQSSGTGALAGTVTDPSGGVISGATVTATNIGTGQARTETTSAEGAYKFSLLPAGNYKVTFSAAGFKTSEVPSIAVAVTETPTLNQTLAVGAQAEQITVESTAETIQAQNATNGALVGSREVTDLPLSSRNYTQIIDLSPGVVVNVASAAAVGNGTQDINVNGSGSDQNNYMMDGASITNYASGGAAQSGNYAGIGIPNPDSIQEFKIQTSQYDASYGRNPGASVNVVTKGGTNQFHGAAWEFARNNFFDANDFFYKHDELEMGGTGVNTPQLLKQNQFGGTLGGPIKKDKLFFFGSYQGTRQINGIGTNGFATGFTTVNLPPFNTPCGARADGCTTPIPAAIQGSTGGVTNSTCGLTGYTYQQYLGCVFGGENGGTGLSNIFGTGLTVAADGSNINPVAINLLRSKGLTGGYNDGFYIPSGSFASSHPGACPAPCSTPISAPFRANENQYLANSDYIISSKHTLSERYFFSSDPQIQPFVCFGGCMPGDPMNADFTTHEGVLKLTSVLTSNFVNEARFSFQRNVTHETDGETVTACGVGMIPMINDGAPCPAPTGVNPELYLTPVIGITGLSGAYGGFTAGGNFFAANLNYINTFQYADQISWNHGKHAIRAGFEAERTQWNWILPSAGRGDIGFASLADFLTSGSAGAAAGGLDDMGTTYLSGDGNYHAQRVNAFSSFAQDDVKVTKRLTVNLGLRWEYDGLPSDKTGLFTNVWASEAALINTGSYFLDNPVGTLAGFVVQSNYNPNSKCGVNLCGLSAPDGATGIYFNDNKTIVHGGREHNFAPRLGVAWQPLGDRFVVRAGWGIFYDRIYGNLLGNNQQAVPPYAGAVPLVASETLANPFEPGAPGWVPRTLAVIGGNPNSVTGGVAGSDLTNNTTSDSEFMGTPLIQEYNLDLQYEVAHNWIVDVGYVGQHGTHLYDWARDINVAHLVAGAPNEPTDAQNAMMVVGAGCSASGTPSPISHAPCSLPFNDPLNPTPITTNIVPNIQGRVTYLGMDPTGLSTTSTVGDDLYNSLQAQLRHQFSHGLLLQVAYTWSKLITNVNSTVAGSGISAPGNVLSGGAGNDDPNNLAQQYGLAAFNRPQRVVISYSYDLPWHHTEGITGKLLSGWTVSGVTTLQDGEPFTVNDSDGGSIYFTPSFFGTNARAELTSPGACNSLGVCKSTVSAATPGGVESRLGIFGGPGYINQAAFGAPPCIGGTVQGSCATSGGGLGFGNAGVGIVSGPGQNNSDISLVKNTKIWEHGTLQFRSEFYNVWNHAQFNPPGNNEAFPSFIGAGGFGVISSSSVPPRVVQFALKYLF
jgi:hypothetical protein